MSLSPNTDYFQDQIQQIQQLSHSLHNGKVYCGKTVQHVSSMN